MSITPAGVAVRTMSLTTSTGGRGPITPNGPSMSGLAQEDLPAQTNVVRTVPAVGSAAVAAGTYSVSTVCLLNRAGTVRAFNGNLIVWGMPG